MDEIEVVVSVAVVAVGVGYENSDVISSDAVVEVRGEVAVREEVLVGNGAMAVLITLVSSPDTGIGSSFLVLVIVALFAKLLTMAASQIPLGMFLAKDAVSELTALQLLFSSSKKRLLVPPSVHMASKHRPNSPK